MQASLSKLARIAASAAVLAAFTLPAAATVRHHPLHKRSVHRIAHRVAARPLTVRRRYYRDPYHGPAAIITAPVAIAGTIVGLPFRMIDVMFPAHANDPRVLVGAPVHLAGQLAQFPFYAFDSAFGSPPNYY